MGPGNDNVNGTSDADFLYGYGGDDTIRGFEADDELRGGTGDDVLFGNDGEDILWGSDGDDKLNGGAGQDRMRGGAGSDTYWIDADANVEDIYDDGRDGIDLVIVLGEDLFRLAGGIENVTRGSTSGGTLNGNFRSNVITGNMGRDLVLAREGEDTVHGREGDDELWGMEGNDRLLGGDGNDIMKGGAGNDYYSVLDSGDRIFEIYEEGLDTIFSAIDFRLPDNIERLKLGGDARTGFGNERNNQVTGNDGRNVLWGGGGNDKINGGGGDDLLRPGTGNDVLIGRGGGDIFAFNAVDSTGKRQTADIISDFKRAEGDVIALRNIDAIEGTPEDDGFTFIGARNFSGAAGELHYRSVNGFTYVEADTDGDRTADFALALRGEMPMLETDFVL